MRGFNDTTPGRATENGMLPKPEPIIKFANVAFVLESCRTLPSANPTQGRYGLLKICLADGSRVTCKSDSQRICDQIESFGDADLPCLCTVRERKTGRGTLHTLDEPTLAEMEAFHLREYRADEAATPGANLPPRGETGPLMAVPVVWWDRASVGALADRYDVPAWHRRALYATYHGDWNQIAQAILRDHPATGNETPPADATKDDPGPEA